MRQAVITHLSLARLAAGVDHNMQVPHHDLQSTASAGGRTSGKHTESTSMKKRICGIPPKHVDRARSRVDFPDEKAGLYLAGNGLTYTPFDRVKGVSAEGSSAHSPPSYVALPNRLAKSHSVFGTSAGKFC